MAQRRPSETSLDGEILELRQRLEEAEETLRAIREGEVDALVIDAPQGEVIYTLTGADYPYRLMIDEMNEGAVSVSPDSFILYSNRHFASILGLTEASASGVSFCDYVVPDMRDQCLDDLQLARNESIRREYTLTSGAGKEVPVLLSFAKLQPETNAIGIVITDLTAQKELQEKLSEAKNTLEEQVAERTKELRQSEARLFRILEHSAADLKAMRRLNEVGTLCANDGDETVPILDEILKVAIDINGADKRNIQLLDAKSGKLMLVTHSGFETPFLEFFAVVDDQGSACAVAMHTHQRVIIEDIRTSEIYAGQASLAAMREADVLAVQSLPLMSSSGNVIGIISTHF